MKRQRRWRWQSCVAVVAVGVLAFGLALQGAPPEGPPVKQKTGQAQAVKVGPGIPATDGIPIFAPVTVDYRDKGAVQRHGPGATALGMEELTSWERSGSFLKARTAGDPCLINEECYTCNVCVAYGCVDFLCAEGYGTCEGGDNNSEPCDDDSDCPDPQPGSCVLLGEDVEGCDDGVYCNGAETCSGGACVTSTNPCEPPDVCDERQDECLPPASQCETAEDCDDGATCTLDDCNDDHVCVYTNACGPGARCLEPEPPDTDPVCIPGRCCVKHDDPAMCSRQVWDNCTEAWLPVGSSDTTCDDLISQCPVYGAGIAVDATITGEVGPISHTSCDDYVTIGDDYETWNHASLDPVDQYMDVTFMRFLARVEPGAVDGARWSIEFRTDTGVLIENTFFPDGQNDEDGYGIRQVNFDPPITIPTKGIVSFTVQANFGLDGRVNVYGTDVTENGINDAGSMYVQRRGEAVGSIREFLGFCNGGPRAGLVCDYATNGNDECSGGTCDNLGTPDILAFELVADPAQKPTGACCDAETGDCTHTLPWECEGAFQGVGSLCGICEDGLTPCTPPGPDVCAVECFPIAACETQACCDVDTGVCIETMGPACSGKVCDNDPTNYTCTQDTDCPEGGTCVDLTGTSSLGFGTDCDPNCCEQPGPYIGANNCLLARDGMPIINVPPLDSPPALVTVTITGDNSTATYDDSDLVCQSGPHAEEPCTEDADCGECVGGGNAGEPCDEDTDCPDSFEGACDAHECDEICTALFLDADGETRDPGWWIAFSIQSVDDCADVRIDLCCSDVEGDALRPAWAQIYGDCPCDDVRTHEGIDSPIGIGRDTEGAARGEPFCDGDNLWMTFRLTDGIYYYPIYSAPGGTSAVPPGSDFQVHITAAACPIAVCCQGTACSYTTEPACAALGGYWLEENVNCGNDPTCADPPGTSSNPCCTGACCTGTQAGVVCLDETPAHQPMTQPDCLVADPFGTYVGGASCDDDPDPCPTCLVESEANCQESAQKTVYITDIDVAPDTRRADDFIASGMFVETVCITGAWTDSEIDCNPPPPEWNRCDCACVDDDQYDCVTQTQDTFTVCVWNDAGLMPGRSSIPGTLVNCSNTTFTRSNNYGPDSGWNFDEYTVSLALADPIPTVIGDIYWLQVYDDTSMPPDNTCNFYWARDGHLDGGDPADPDPPESIGGNDKVMQDLDGTLWEPRDIRNFDMAICLNYPIEPPPAKATGACCSCDPLGDCLDDVEAEDCFGPWYMAQDCAPGLCPLVRPPNDVCTTGIIPVGVGTHEFNNICATTDGVDSVCYSDCGYLPNCADYPCDIGADIWYAYTADCTGRLTVSMCDDADYDAVMEIYTDNSPVCPCPGPTGQGIVCGDDTCGVTFGPAEVELVLEDADLGNCYTIRIMGWRSLPEDEIPACEGGCMGSGNFTISCETVTCFPPDPPTEDTKCPPEGCEQGTCGTKGRYVSFHAGVPGELQAIRMTFVSLPPPHNFANGRTYWVQTPFLVTEASGSDQPGAPPQMWAARLGPDPVYLDWSTYDVVDVFNAGLVGEGVYDVQAIKAGDLIAVEECYSAPLTVRLSELGDVVGNRTAPPPQSPPQCVCDFNDISGCVDKFKNTPSAPRKARADLVNSTITLPEPDRKIDFVDITCAVECFRGHPCALPGPTP